MRMLETESARPLAPPIHPAVVLAVLLALGTAVHPCEASLTRNPAGAKNIGDAGTLTVDTAAEYESEGGERTWTFGPDVQYQVSPRIQLLAQAALYTRIRPEEGEAESGLGDTELTLSWLAARERGFRPSAVLGGRVKLPTAGNDAIGTGKPDWFGLVVLGKEWGEVEGALELEYGTLGSPGDERLQDQFRYTMTGEWSVNDLLAVYAELFGNSAPTEGEDRSDAALAGVEFDIPVSERVSPYVSAEVDTEGGTAARFGIEWSW